jgi:hypothetical protein
LILEPLFRPCATDGWALTTNRCRCDPNELRKS